MKSDLEPRYNPKTVWNEYSKDWEKQNPKENYLGEEWKDPRDEIRKKFVDPFLIKEKKMISLEIGPGGGKWTEVLLELSEQVFCVDISQEMLDRVKTRFPKNAALKILRTDGITLSGIPKNCLHFFFSYDTFVHLEPRDIYNYLKQIYSLMKPGAIGVVHYSNVLSKDGWKKLVASIYPDNLLNRRIGFEFSIMTMEIMTKFLSEIGFKILSTDSMPTRDLITSFEKPNI